ncbi:TPA: elongation factor Ts [bacterium]|nr:elongation factor Ts [bacterium]
MNISEMIKVLRVSTGAGILDCKKALEATDNDLDKAIDWLREKGISKAAKKAHRIAAEGLCDIVTDGNSALIVEMNSETDFVAKNEKFIEFVREVAKSALAAKAKNAEEALAAKSGNGTVNDLVVGNTATIGEKLSLRRVDLFEKSDNDIFGTYLHMGGKIGVITVLENTDNEEVARDIAMHIAASNPTYLKESDIPSEEVENERKIQLEATKNDEKLKDKPENVLKGIVEGKLNKWKKEICLLDQPFVKDTSMTVEQYLKNNNTNVVKYVRYLVGEGLEKRQDDFAQEVYSQVEK